MMGLVHRRDLIKNLPGRLLWVSALSALVLGCGEPTTVPFQVHALNVALTDVVIEGRSRCEFTLRMSSISDNRPVSFSWVIDQERSSLPTAEELTVSDAGSFVALHEQVWEIRQPDNGFALILNMTYTMSDELSKRAGRLITYCP